MTPGDSRAMFQRTFSSVTDYRQRLKPYQRIYVAGVRELVYAGHCIPAEVQPHPLAPFAGSLPDDPWYDAWQREILDRRHSIDQDDSCP